ncbi:hypothetical protein E8E13_004536 [Curvularia kusanoi]|uniref:Uncharacterized protein n=1 Tax=Curvularia kusanoi TaxID=90978 RepID=A0A9P4T8H4_CURKU|nr:hypothetical protein E8E13_004536 [Curvularia kusanoi]
MVDLDQPSSPLSLTCSAYTIALKLSNRISLRLSNTIKPSHYEASHLRMPLQASTITHLRRAWSSTPTPLSTFAYAFDTSHTYTHILAILGMLAGCHMVQKDEDRFGA